MTSGTAVGAGTLHAQHATVLEALDAERMGPLLAATLGVDPGTPCSVADAKYEPGRPATVLYRLGSDLVHATVPPPGDIAPGRQLPNGVGVMTFPDDPGLPTLPVVADARRFAAALGRALDLPGGGREVEVALVRYRPGRRATFLVSVRVDGPARYVAKVYHDGAKAAAVAAEGRALQGLDLSPPLVLAPVEAHLPDLAVVVQGHLPGRELVLDLTDPLVVARRSPDVVRAARALASLHRGSVPTGRPRPVDRELLRFVDRASVIGSVDPANGELLLALAHDLLAWRPAPGPVSLVHGDCKPSQFLVDGDRVAVLDLDHCGIAEPASDVGNFVSSLLQGAVRAAEFGETRDASVALGATFVTAYLDGAEPSAADELTERTRFYVAVSLLRKALRAWARSPLTALPGRYVAEARRATADLRGWADGRR
jgi:Ser/Thr protein kinase RdoA (MazF antagonist)